VHLPTLILPFFHACLLAAEVTAGVKYANELMDAGNKNAWAMQQQKGT